MAVPPKGNNPPEKQKNLEKQLDGDTKAVKTGAGITSAKETSPPESGYDKRGKHEVDNKGQAFDEEVTSEVGPSKEDNTLKEDNIYFECTSQEFSPGTISSVSTCQECNTSYSFEDLEWSFGTFCSRFYDSSENTVCGNRISHGDLKDHIKKCSLYQTSGCTSKRK